MLSSSQLKEQVEVIIDSLVGVKLEEARQALTHLAPDVSSEYGRGALLALNGILNVTENKSRDKMAGPDSIIRVAEHLPKVEMLDDLDKGYLQTLSKWAKKVKDSDK